MRLARPRPEPPLIGPMGSYLTGVWLSQLPLVQDQACLLITAPKPAKPVHGRFPSLPLAKRLQKSASNAPVIWPVRSF